VAKPELVRTAAFFVARNGPCSERRKRLKLAIGFAELAYRLGSGAFFFVSFAFGELAGFNFLKNNYLSILLGSFGRAKEMKNQVTKLLDINKVQRCV
jgi:hypothetical protein